MQITIVRAPLRDCTAVLVGEALVVVDDRLSPADAEAAALARVREASLVHDRRYVFVPK